MMATRPVCHQHCITIIPALTVAIVLGDTETLISLIHVSHSCMYSCLTSSGWYLGKIPVDEGIPQFAAHRPTSHNCTPPILTSERKALVR